MRAGSVAASSLVVDLGGICVVSSQFRAPFGEAAYGIFRIGFPVRDEAIEMLHFRCQIRQRFGIRASAMSRLARSSAEVASSTLPNKMMGGMANPSKREVDQHPAHRHIFWEPRKRSVKQFRVTVEQPEHRTGKVVTASGICHRKSSRGAKAIRPWGTSG